MSEEKLSGSGRNAPANPNKAAADELSKQILGSLRSFAGEETQRWILNLDDLEVKQEAQGVAVADTIQDMTSVNLIDKIFDDFQRYAFEFNKKSPAEPFIQCERPVSTKTSSPSKHSHGESPVVFQGHLVTRSWAMITQAQQEKISFYVVPTEHYFGFNPRSFDSFVDIETKQENGKINWVIGHEPLTLQMLPSLSKKLFAFIVKVEKGESDSSERFTLKSTREEPINLPPKPDQSDVHALLTPDMSSGAASASAQTRTKEDRGHRSTKTAQGKTPLEQNLNAVRTVCHDFMQAMDDELNKITQLGVQAMQSQDLVVVQKVMRRTATLKSFKERMKAMLEEWKSVSHS